jgi:hypothetical protein
MFAAVIRAPLRHRAARTTRPVFQEPNEFENHTRNFRLLSSRRTASLFARIEMQIHVMTVAKHVRLRYSPSSSIELEAGVNPRSKHDFMMYPELKDRTDSPPRRQPRAGEFRSA